MRIGAVARATGVSEGLLRYYEEQGLLTPTRLPSGYREYGEADVAAVRNIRALLAAGLPIRVIADVLPCICEYSERIVPTCPAFIVSLRREQARINDAIDELRTSQKLLDIVLDAAPPAVSAAADRTNQETFTSGINRAAPTTRLTTAGRRTQ
jgi:DNA-binding transcriptional MerR regulator